MNSARMSVWLLLASCGCVGTISGPTTGDSPPPPSGAGAAPGGVPVPAGPGIPGGSGCQERAPAVTAIRRLTRDEYRNTLGDLLGDAQRMVPAALPRDDAGDDVVTDPRTLIVSPDWAANAMEAAEAAARTAMANLTTLLPCNPASDEQACARQFAQSLGKRAFRRPLVPAEVDALMKVYAVGAQGGGFNRGVEVLVRAILQSPSFLYRGELGQREGSSAGAIRLTAHEVAARLSYLLWGTMPDGVLTAAADAGKLGTGDEVAAQARRMLGDPRAHERLAEFHGRWLGIDGLDEVAKDPMKYPQFGDALAASMRRELALFVDDVLWSGDARLESLFSARFTYVDAALAPLYGVPAPTGGTTARVELDPAQRAGILTMSGIIAAHTFADESEPIHRGKFVRERLLCTVPPDPPADLMVQPPMPKPGLSIRERLAEHSNLPACQACHQLMDPIGLGFEAYDGLGRFRTSEGGKAVDDRGVLSMTDVDGPFEGAIELGQKLAGSAQVRACLIGTALRYAHGPDATGDACVQQKLSSAFDGAKHDLRELIVAITRTEGFRYRRPIDGEVLPP
jgi:hypothetical protein